MKRKLPSFSRLLAPVLIVGILICAGLFTYVTLQSYNREQANMKSFTHDRMKLLVLDLETKVMSVQAAMVAASRIMDFDPQDTTAIFDRLEEFVSQQKIIRHAGFDWWTDDDQDSTFYTLYVSELPDGSFRHIQGRSMDMEISKEDNDTFDRAMDTHQPAWSHPYEDALFAEASIVSCYTKIPGVNEMLCADVDLEDLFDVLDSLQFFEGSRMFIEVPGGDIYSHSDGNITHVDSLKIDEKKYTKISAHYRHLDIDIVNVVPHDKVYRHLWRQTLIVLGLLLVGIAFISFLVMRSFRKAQAKLTTSIMESHKAQLARKRLEDEISIAANIQTKMLTSPNIPAHYAPEGCRPVDIMSRIIPAREVGGDLYEYRLQGDKLFFCVGDVSGKGIPASVVMTMCSTLFHAFVSNVDNPVPSNLLGFLNRQLCRHNEELMFVTAWAGAIDLKTGAMEYASAGHNPPVLVRGGDASFLEMKQGTPLGMFDGTTYSSLECRLSQADMLVLYTDGITEAEGPGNVLFGDERLLDVCRNTSSKCPEIMCRSILDAVRNHAHDCMQSDDITLLCITFDGHCAQLRSIGDVSALHTLTAECGASDEAALALEEAAVNRLTHGGASFVSAEYRDGVFVLTSDGDDFDPTAYVAPPPTGELKVSGRGIFIMKQICKEIRYRRTEEGLSVLELTI